ncbi:MAG TPA: hypothetical protein VEJ86_06200, partial [Candidatus Binataceae bacterium]|nr:hypothetical protein [Candidatus Binataceae bacterium]
MSARNAIILTVLLAILLPYYLLADRPQVTAAQVPQTTQETLLKLNAISAVTVIRGAETVRYQKAPDGRLFTLTEPAHAFVPQDLMQALSA